MRLRSEVLCVAWAMVVGACSPDTERASPAPGAEPAPEQPPPRFRARLELPVRGAPSTVRILDLDGDGRPELAATSRGIPTPAGSRGELGLWLDGPGGAPRTIDLPDWLLGPEPCAFAEGPRLVLASQATSELLWLDPMAPDPAATLGRFDLGDRPRVLAVGRLASAGPETIACATRSELVLVTPGQGVTRHPLPELLPTLLRLEPGRLVLGTQAGDRLWCWDVAAESGLVGEPRPIELGGIPRDLLARDGAWLVACGDRELVTIRDEAVTGRRDLGAIPLAVRPFEDDVCALTFYDLTLHLLGSGRRLYAGQDPRGLATGDLDGDGRAEIALANRGAGRVSLLRGGPDGPIEARTVPTRRGPSRLAIGRGEDGVEVVVSCALEDRFVVLDAAAGELRADQPSGGGADHPALVDLDGDGRLDLVFLRTAPEGSRAVFRPGRGQGVFDDGAEVELRLDSHAADLVALPPAADGGGPRLALSFPTKGEVALFALAEGALRQVDRLRLGDAPVVPTRLAPFANEAGVSLAVLLAPGGDRTGVVWLAEPAASAGKPGAWREESALELAVHGLDLAPLDHDGDGTLDLALLAAGADGPDGAGRVVLARPAENGWEAFHQEPAGQRPFAIAAGDLDGDGRDDLVVGAQNSHHVNVWLARGASLARLPDLGVGRGPLDVAIADVDGDGRPEVLAANNFSNDVSVVATE